MNHDASVSESLAVFFSRSRSPLLSIYLIWHANSSDQLTDRVLETRLTPGAQSRDTLCQPDLQICVDAAAMIWWQHLKLKSKDPQVRLKAIQALGAHDGDDPKTIELLTARLTDADPAVRCAAAKVLGDGKNASAAELLIPLLSDPNSGTRQEAAAALGHLGDPAAIDPLIKLLKHSNPQDRGSAGVALRALAWVPATPEEQALFEVAVGNARAAALQGKAALDPLISELTHDTSFARRSAAEALEGLKDPRRVKPLLQAAKDPDPTVRVSAIHALAAEQEQPVINTLLRALRDHEACVRLAAAQVLAKRDNPDFVPHFFSLLHDSHFDVRLAAVHYLSRFRHEQITQALVALLVDRDSDVRLAAVTGLAGSDHSAAVEGLVVALVDEERAIREAAQRALDQINPDWPHSEAAQRARQHLENLMNSCPAWVHSAISQVLARLRSANENIQVVHSRVP